MLPMCSSVQRYHSPVNCELLGFLILILGPKPIFQSFSTRLIKQFTYQVNCNLYELHWKHVLLEKSQLSLQILEETKDNKISFLVVPCLLGSCFLVCLYFTCNFLKPSKKVKEMERTSDPWPWPTSHRHIYKMLHDLSFPKSFYFLLKCFNYQRY